MTDLEVPMTPDERRALDDYVAVVRRHYGARLQDIVLFGSRARGEGTEESDFDIAIILSDGDWRKFDELMLLSDLAFDTMLEHGVYIQATPIVRSDWLQPERHSNPLLIKNIQRDSQSLLVPP
jgi:predicted nucleotidyltransferase